MPLKLPDKLPAIEILKNENIFVMDTERATHQDIRPLRIVVLNLMPVKLTTETDLIRLLSNTPLQIELKFMKIKGHTSKNTPVEHMKVFYETFESIRVKYKNKYTRQKFLTEIMGEFIEAMSEVFGNFKACVVTPEDMKPVYGGLDFGAATGSDETCLTLMNKDRQIVYRWATADQDPVSQIVSLASVINVFPSLKAVYVEKNSIGNVYLSMLRKQVNNIALIRAFDTTNENKREMIENLIVAFEQHLIGIDNDPMLWSQLAGFEMKKLKKGYTYGNDSDKRHDDRVLSLAFAYSLFNDKPSGTIGFSKK